MSGFKLVSDFAPTGDQPQAIEKLVKAFQSARRRRLFSVLQDQERLLPWRMSSRSSIVLL